MSDEPDRLLSVAASLADGTPVAWEEEARATADEHDAATLEALRDL
jgi:hypothetical protein